MCDFEVIPQEIGAEFAIAPNLVAQILAKARAALPNVLEMNDGILSIPPEARPLTRIIARQFDAYDLSKAGHSSAI